ncbi:MaoC family dehydratase N-terminal domain-containing protein [Pseudalkalibacillus caeni]|uniref:MaoC family dehydratase n=1 Tax=Exobacillus caeni TaxID=2574798 RepID=A0A5R9F351_9BACL|nr:MaoC family dehydratase N-terminal domain-containing protein [Pseudalkalibacillus caeni]TLS36919.1 MaoC family dehydratase [Pseudalkalibacillus caeni]
MFHDFIGKKSEKVKNVIERGAVKKFAEAIGDPHPLFVSEEYGKKSRFKQNIAPPTFPRALDYGEIEGMNLPNKGLIHGEQIYHYERPLFVGEEIYCSTEIKNYYERKGSSGELSFLVLTRRGEDNDGKTIFTEEQVVIITEAVKKELMV